MTKSKSVIGNIFNGVSSNIKKQSDNAGHPANLGWLTVKYLKHLPDGQLNQHKLLGKPTFFYNGYEYLYGVKEIFVAEIYKQHLPENAVVLDCGAHIGLSVLYIKSICPTAKIIAFEPDKKNYALLQKNIASHQFNNITVENKAVWTADTTLSFVEDGNMGSKIGEGNTATTKQVQAVRLLNYLNEPIDFLKLDVEGAEYEILKDIANKLCQVKNMFLEYHGKFEQQGELMEIFDILHKSGFKFTIKEAAHLHDHPFLPEPGKGDYDVQLNIFCWRK